MNEEIVDKNGNINISLENTMRLLKENDNSKVKAVEIEKVLSNTFLWGKETIKYLTRQYKDKGE